MYEKNIAQSVVAALATNSFKLTKFDQEGSQLVVLAPETYHGGFNIRYDVAKAINIVDYLRIPSSLSACKKWEIGRPTGQCVLPLDLKVWKEANALVAFLDKRRHLQVP